MQLFALCYTVYGDNLLNEWEGIKLKKFYFSVQFTLILLIMFAWTAPTIAGIGFEPVDEVGKLVFSSMDKGQTCQSCYTDKIDLNTAKTGKAIDYGAAQNAYNPAVNCAELFKITKLIKPDNPQFRRAVANGIDSGNRQHYPLK